MFCCLCFTLLVSFTGFYTEDEPKDLDNEAVGVNITFAAFRLPSPAVDSDTKLNMAGEINDRALLNVNSP